MDFFRAASDRCSRRANELEERRATPREERGEASEITAQAEALDDRGCVQQHICARDQSLHHRQTPSGAGYSTLHASRAGARNGLAARRARRGRRILALCRMAIWRSQRRADADRSGRRRHMMTIAAHSGAQRLSIGIGGPMRVAYSVTPRRPWSPAHPQRARLARLIPPRRVSIRTSMRAGAAASASSLKSSRARWKLGGSSSLSTRSRSQAGVEQSSCQSPADSHAGVRVLPPRRDGSATSPPDSRRSCPCREGYGLSSERLRRGIRAAARKAVLLQPIDE